MESRWKTEILISSDRNINSARLIHGEKNGTQHNR